MPEPIAWLLVGEPVDKLPAGIKTEYFLNDQAALTAVENNQQPVVVLCYSQFFNHLYQQNIRAELPYDLIHAGLKALPSENMKTPLFSNLNWHLLDPFSALESASWKATPHVCFLRPSVVRALGGFDNAYDSPTMKLMDFAHRLLRNGGRLLYCPEWLPTNLETQNQAAIQLDDELLFIRRRLGGRFSAWYAAMARGIAKKQLKKSLRAAWAAEKSTRKFVLPPRVRLEANNTRLLAPTKRQRVTTITAVIPTLNRYEYLPQAIDSLLSQSTPPVQIVIVDQTPEEKRQPALYQKYDQQIVDVIYLDEAGQSLARNAAIQAAVGDWCLFFDDDSEAWDNMITAHIQAIEHSGAVAATGVSLAPWKNRDYIPEGFRHYHLANVLDTGNSLVKKSALYDVGGFDRAFDKGSGADNDLGTRLHLHGFEIIFNPQAIRTHYKATQGGLRTHGAWWRHQSARKAPFPPPTQIYTIRQYYPRPCWPALYFLFYLRAKRHHSLWGLMGLWLTLPWKLPRSLRAADRLKTNRELEKRVPQT